VKDLRSRGLVGRVEHKEESRRYGGEKGGLLVKNIIKNGT
jgi:hypothetical protein